MFKKRSFALLLAAGMMIVPFMTGCDLLMPEPDDGPELQEPDKGPDKEPDKEPDKGTEESFVLSFAKERYLLAAVEGATQPPRSRGTASRSTGKLHILLQTRPLPP